MHILMCCVAWKLINRWKWWKFRILSYFSQYHNGRSILRFLHVVLNHSLFMCVELIHATIILSM